MKKYIILTSDIRRIGGMQCMVAGKVKYLRSQGWDVYVLFNGMLTKSGCIITELDKYLDGRISEMIYPPSFYTRRQVNRIVEKMVSVVGSDNSADTILESHSDRTALWAELLARRIHAKHYFLMCTEHYEGKDYFYQPYLDFFKFKHQRREIAAEVPEAYGKLFGEKYQIKEEEKYIFALDEDPVQEVNNPLVESIVKDEWSIGYIGRTEKGYFPNIVNGICKFADRHIDKKISFIIIGDTSWRKEELQKCRSHSNIRIIELGNVVPIPKSFFNKVDVVIAGSGSARCSVYEGIPTILADSLNFLSDGLLGYETKDFLYNGDPTALCGFDESLEKVLVDQIHKKMKFDFIPKMSPGECVEQNLKLFSKSEPSFSYYDSNIICKGAKHPILTSKLFISKFIRNTFMRV